jgi:hypothetical protein
MSHTPGDCEQAANVSGGDDACSCVASAFPDNDDAPRSPPPKRVSWEVRGPAQGDSHPEFETAGNLETSTLRHSQCILWKRQRYDILSAFCTEACVLAGLGSRPGRVPAYNISN